MCVRVDVFGQDNAQLFPAGTRGAALFKTVHDCLTQAQTLAGQQDSGARTRQQNTQTKAVLRETLRAMIKRMSDTAIGMDFDSPGLAAMFRLPRRTDAQLVSAARAFLLHGEPLKDEFIKNELPADSFDQLRQLLARFETATSEQARGSAQKVNATAGIAETLAQAVRAVKQLAPIVRNKLQNNPAALATWESASHVERAPKTKKPAPKPTPTAQA
jgi:hypothetical protein